MSVLNGYHHYVDSKQQNNPVPVLAYVDIFQNPYYVSRYVVQFLDNIHRLPLIEEIFGNAVYFKEKVYKKEKKLFQKKKFFIQ